MKKNNTLQFIVMGITYALILITAVIFKLPYYRLLPILISAIVMFFQSKAYRIGYLLGGLNSIVYAAVYVGIKLYASAASAFLFSFPVQIATFINWKRNAYEQSVSFKKMSNTARLLVSLVTLTAWLVVLFITSKSDSPYAILDSLASVIGVLTSILTLFAYIEYSYIWVVGSAIGIFNNFQVVLNDPAHITYLFYSFYSAFCVVLAVVNVHKLYKEQKNKGKEEIK